MMTAPFRPLARFFAGLLVVLCLLLASSAPAFSAIDAGAPQATPPSALDSLAKALQDKPGAGGLVAKLIQAEQQSSKTPAAQKGFIGLISNSLGVLQGQLHQATTPQKYWAEQFSLAWQDLSTILDRQDGEPPLTVLQNFLAMLALFGVIASTLRYVGRRVRQHFDVNPELPPDPSFKELLIFILRRIVPWVLALVVEISVVLSLEPSLGRTLATILLYTLIGARVFRAICAIIFSLSHGGHRNIAIGILYRRAWGMLYVIGCAGWFGDALNNPHVYQIVGINLSHMVATLANLTAAIFCGVFALRFRRPVAHVIRNRPLEIRISHRARMETLEVIASLWHLPILLLAGSVSVATVLGHTGKDAALNHALGSVALLVAMFFISALLQRIRSRKRRQQMPRRRPSPYVQRLRNAGYGVLQLTLWIGFFELLTRIWEGSLLEFADSTLIGQMISAAIGKIGATLALAWLVWILLDTAIQEAISPSRPNRYARKKTSTRMRTILPLLRNALMLLILTVTVITTLANLGINVTPLLASAGVVGLAFGFGSQSLVKDLITGVFILIEDSMSVGDWVDVGNGHAGIVEHLTIRTVRLRDSSGSVHSIPFSQITAIKNDSREYTYASLKLSVTHDSDIDQALRLMRETGAEMQEDRRLRRLLQQPIEIYGINSFDLHGAALLAGFRTRPQTQNEVMRAFNLRIKKKIDNDPTVHFANEWSSFPLAAAVEKPQE